ncbi:MAG: hypothetical protein H0T57_14715 [Rubrobacter sp.]|nr:hypothetical protein [Rubrobacter sp.]
MDAAEKIKEQVGSAKAICGLSGGVDSSTAAMLVHRAIGDNLTCVFVDHGLLRQNEAEQVVEAFGKNSDVPLIHVDAKDRFVGKLEGVADPETKRKIIKDIHRKSKRTYSRSKTSKTWSRSRSSRETRRGERPGRIP